MIASVFLVFNFFEDRVIYIQLHGNCKKLEELFARKLIGLEKERMSSKWFSCVFASFQAVFLLNLVSFFFAKSIYVF